MSIGRPKQLADSMKAVTIFFVLLPRASAAGPGTPEYLERLYQWGVTPKPMDHTSYQSPLTTLTEGNTWCPSGKVAKALQAGIARLESNQLGAGGVRAQDAFVHALNDASFTGGAKACNATAAAAVAVGTSL